MSKNYINKSPYKINKITADYANVIDYRDFIPPRIN